MKTINAPLANINAQRFELIQHTNSYLRLRDNHTQFVYQLNPGPELSLKYTNWIQTGVFAYHLASTTDEDEGPTDHKYSLLYISFKEGPVLNSHATSYTPQPTNLDGLDTDALKALIRSLERQVSVLTIEAVKNKFEDRDE